MSFEHDVFISYAHIDNETAMQGKDGWISSFHRALEIRVGQLLGKKPAIWRDPKLHGNDYFENTLVDRLPGVALLVSVISPRYVNSEWCTRELKEFCLASEKTGGLRLADKARVFKVVKTPVPPERHPQEIKPLLGYEFYTVDPETGRPRELDHILGEGAQREYWARLDDLAHDITELLERIPESSDSGQTQPSEGLSPSAARGTVFLAETTFDLKETHNAMRRDLQRHGFRILPDKTLPLIASEFETAVKEYLAECQMSIHLIGKNSGLVPEGATDSILAIQHELAIQRATSNGFSRLIWIPAGLTIEDERQKEFVDHLRNDPRFQEGADLLETPLEDLKTVIHSRFIELAEVKAKRESTAEVDETGPSRVYLICDKGDREAINELSGYLFDRGYEVIQTLFEGDEAEVREDHEENLRICDAALIFYGNGNDLWLRRKLRELRKIAGYGRTKPIRAKGIVVASPDTPQKQSFRTHEAVVMVQPEGFAAEALQPFLEAIGPL